MNRRNALIAWELLLLFASVPVFRSIWLFLDKLPWASTPAGLLALLIPGVLLCIVALRGIHSKE